MSYKDLVLSFQAGAPSYALQRSLQATQVPSSSGVALHDACGAGSDGSNFDNSEDLAECEEDEVVNLVE